MVTARRYLSTDASAWDGLLAESNLPHFMLSRGYIGYHGTRFLDHSLIFEDSSGPLALLPAHERSTPGEGTVLASHDGLTFGGFAAGERVRARAASDIVRALREYLVSNGISRFACKFAPFPYYKCPSEEIEHALVTSGARLSRSYAHSFIGPQSHPRPNRAKRHVGRLLAKKEITVRESDDLPGFYGMLCDWLKLRYGAVPVHTLGELEYLRSLFPGHIRVFAACLGDHPLAARLVFETPRCIKIQYAAATAQGLELNAPTSIYLMLIERAQSRWLDLGTSTDPGTGAANFGLLEFKESFGARAIVARAYEWDVNSAGDSP